MISEEVLNKFLRDCINIILNNSEFTIRGQQNTPVRPLASYADVVFLSSVSQGIDSIEYSDLDAQNITSTRKGLREISFSINTYKDFAIDNIRKIKIGFLRESILSLFRSANIGFMKTSNVRNITEALDNGFEQRGQLDIFMYIVDNDEDVIARINSVDIQGEYQYRNLKYNSTIEIRE